MEEGLCTTRFKDMNQAGASHFLGLEGPPCLAFGVVPSIDMLACGSGKGSHLFSLGDHLGIGVGGAAAGGCSSMGMFWQAEQTEMMEMITPIRHGRR